MGYAASASRRAPQLYRPRAAEHTVLARIVRAHLATFLRVASAHDDRGLPAFVEQEFRDFLGCGVWSRGFARFRCDACHAERFVPFSCKARAVYPSCGGRRMAERAAHLVERVLPAVPIRQWVLSLPHRLRYLCAWDHGLCRAVLRIYARALLSFMRRRAQRQGVSDGRSGAVTAIQRFGSAVNLNVHFHTLVLDGVFVPDARRPERIVADEEAGGRPAASTSDDAPRTVAPSRRYFAWAELLRRVFAIDVLACAYGGRLRFMRRLRDEKSPARGRGARPDSSLARASRRRHDHGARTGYPLNPHAAALRPRPHQSLAARVSSDT